MGRRWKASEAVWLGVVLLYGSALCGQEPASAPSVERAHTVKPAGALRAPSVRFALRPRTAYVVPLTEAILKPRQSTRAPATGASLKVDASAESVGGCETMPDGSQIWRLVLKSPGARALRVHFRNFDAGAGTVWLSTAEDPAAHSIGPYSGQGLFGDGEFWSGVVLSESVAVDYEPGAGESCGPVPPFQVSEITHLWGEPNEASSQAAADGCNNDVSCYANWAKQAHSVARITFVAADGYSYLCSGALVNTKPYSGRALFLTANHCVGSDAIARTVNAFWFYETPYCNGPPPNMHSLPYQTVGAHYLASAPEPLGDYSLIELASLPNTPTLSWSGWTTAEPDIGDTITAIHHPGNSNDYKRISFGKRGLDRSANIQGEGLAPGQLFFTVDWASGATEPGSSGSPLFAYNAALGDNAIIGMDSYGPFNSSTTSACTTGGYAGFGRMSAAYPALRTYLNTSACTYGFAPSSNTSGPLGGSGSITISTGIGCTWTASSDSYWVTLGAPLKQTGPGSVAFNVLPNNSSAPRSATVSIGGQEFTVTQMALQPGCTATQIGPNQTVTGSLSAASCASVTDPSAYANRYSLSLNAGQQIAIALNSTSFDAFLTLLDPSGAVLVEDDDGGGGTNSRIPASTGFYTVPASGVYLIEATSYDAYQTGAYSLQITSPGPATPANPTPADGATAVSTAPVLSWTGATGSVVYDVALSKANPPALYATGRGATALALSALTPGAKYYWYVIARSPSGLAQSATWSFTVANAPSVGNSLPFGAFDTPANNATVDGSIGVTGWALDGSGIAGLEIWRDPVGGEPAQSNGLVLLTHGVFISGARPDVQGLYASYPGSDRAGWGCLVLTNMLPNTNGTAGNGNGTYRLHAIARGNDGRSTEVGTKTIVANNAQASTPFGSIDTPAEGETVSGSAYVSFGWALTQTPKAIATDGSTISVLIDGQPAGHPSFNHYRSDIASLFPGYANALGAVGFFTLDTTKLTNGLHTISWAVSDNAGKSSGIGSRFFTVQN